MTLQTVYKAIQAGYRLFDGASDYGNEKEAGDGIARAIKDGLVKREDLCESLSRIYNHRMLRFGSSHHFEALEQQPCQG